MSKDEKRKFLIIGKVICPQENRPAICPLREEEMDGDILEKEETLSQILKERILEFCWIFCAEIECQAKNEILSAIKKIQEGE